MRASLFVGALLLLASFVSVAGARADAAPAAPQEGAVVNGSVSPDGHPHPGTIRHVDRIRDKEWTEPAADVPQSIAWVQVGASWRAVVRIEVAGDDARRCITRFGEDGAMLDTTYQIAQPPPRRPDPGPVPVPTPTPTNR